ncbi:hypothetical protein CRUP_033082 [Coryphaenoides rupestris]|nr:hypothetical protein CRUP_033082 [Coryphaenoides rupestris]
MMISKLQKATRSVCIARGMHLSALKAALPAPTAARREVIADEEAPGPDEARTDVTGSFGRFISGLKSQHLSPTALQRSKRMVLDSLGVGLLGSTTEVFELALQHCQQMYAPDHISSVYGRSGTKLSATLAAFVNGVAVHSMDFDDTWHPATHPSGAVLPALLAVSDMMPANRKPSGLDLLLAFNVGIEIQGRLLRFSNGASNIPKNHALAIAASLAGAPMANAATQSKPLHIGNASRLGMEAALLASRGLEASPVILDFVPGVAGFSAFYEDYTPQPLNLVTDEGHNFLIEDQDIAFKRFPAHLGMHWVVDAAASVHKLLAGSASRVKEIVLRVPRSKYINRPHPECEHQARHSFQFNACSALLDGEVTVQSFTADAIARPELAALLGRVRVEHPTDNPANFDLMYCEVHVTLETGDVLSGRCNTFYGHWRNPLTNESLRKKFRSNAGAVLPWGKVEGLIEAVESLEDLQDCTPLLSQLQ